MVRRFRATSLGVLLLAAMTMLLAAAMPAAAELKLTIQNGRVTLDARDVTVRQILAEWGRLGQTHIVNGDKVPGGLVNLKFVDLPESKALDILLRGVGGYMAAPRPVFVAAASAYDRILILATSTPPPSSAAPRATPPMPMPTPMQPGPPANDNNDSPGDPGDQPTNENLRMSPRPQPFPFPGPAQPMPQAFPGTPGASGVTPGGPGAMPVTPGGENPAATQPSAGPVPSGTSPLPGVVIQPPPQPGQPRPPQRPPVP